MRLTRSAWRAASRSRGVRDPPIITGGSGCGKGRGRLDACSTRKCGPTSNTTGFASQTDSNSSEFVEWQDATAWLARSGPVGDRSDALADLAATVREAN